MKDVRKEVWVWGGTKLLAVATLSTSQSQTVVSRQIEPPVEAG